MPLPRFIFIIFLFAVQNSFAQQNNIWYFGKQAGLNFNTSRPTPLHNSVMDADEGSASICDATGNLLFYTNGLTVYNRNHQAMLNGSGLASNISTVQSAVIVPLPGSSSIYYIFTADALENSFVKGYNYSIVDMTRDGGKGEVITKNVPFSGTGTERLIGARHADGTSVWIITNDKSSNVFRAWLMGCSGLSASPVVSTSGQVLDGHVLTNTGMIKVSPDGKLLCQMHFPYFDDGAVTPNFFQLFDFDNVTGVISNARTIDPGGASMTSCEFSPNSRLLYISRAYDKKIDQYDISVPTPPAMLASRFTINADDKFFGIQLGPDQKIYLATPSKFLGVINNPNVRGAGCGFVKEAINLNEDIGGMAYAGLPTFINDLSFDGSNGFTYTIVDSCTGEVQFNGMSTIPGSLTWTWDFGDGGTSNQQNPLHIFPASAPSYTVKLKIQTAGGCGTIDRAKTVIPGGLILNVGFDFIAKCDSDYVRFTNTSTFSPDTALIQYAWDFGDGNSSNQPNPIHSFATPGTFNVQLQIKTTTACLDKSLSKSVNLELLDIQAPGDVEIDAGQSVPLPVTGGGTSFAWTPITGLSNPAVVNPVAKPPISTMYVVTAFNDAGCKDVDSVFIKVKPVPGIYVPSGFTPNNDGKNDVFRPILSDFYNLEEFSIYNRWGEKVFTTSQKGVGWNGKIEGIVQNSDVYVWIVRALDRVTGIKHERKGTFTVIR